MNHFKTERKAVYDTAKFFTECSGAWVVTGCDDSSGSSGPSPSGSSGTTGNNGTSTSPPDSNEPAEEDGTITPDEQITAISPFALLTENEEPCNKITSLLALTEIKNRIQNLKTQATLNLSYEKGYDINLDGTSLSITENNGEPNDTFIKVSVNEQGTTICFIHSHFNGNRMQPQFSIEDIRTLNAIYQYRKYNNKPLDDLTVIVVSQAGVYALVIKDYNVFSSKGNKLHTSKFNNLKYKYEKKFPKVQNLMSEAEDMENIILKNVNSYGLSLFKANDDLSGWKELKINAQNETTTRPCN